MRKQDLKEGTKESVNKFVQGEIKGKHWIVVALIMNSDGKEDINLLMSSFFHPTHGCWEIKDEKERWRRRKKNEEKDVSNLTMIPDNNQIIRYCCTNFLNRGSRKTSSREMYKRLRYGLNDAESRQGNGSLNAKICFDKERKSSSSPQIDEES